MFEALCCGVPVIINESIGVRRYIRDGANGFNVPLSATGFARAAEKLSEMVHNREWRQAIAEQSARRFGSDTVDAQYARHIASLLEI